MKRSSIRDKLRLRLVAIMMVALVAAIVVGMVLLNGAATRLFETLVRTFAQTTASSSSVAVDKFESHLLQERLRVLVQEQAVKYLVYVRVVERVANEGDSTGRAKWKGRVWANVEPDYKKGAGGELVSGKNEPGRDKLKRGDVLVGEELADPLTGELLGSVKDMKAESMKEEVRPNRWHNGKRVKVYALPVVGAGAGKTDGAWGMLEIGVTEDFLTVTRGRVFLWFLGLMGIVCAGGVWYVQKSVGELTEPIQDLVTVFKEMAEAGGDLTRQIPVRTNDELGELADATNKMRAGIAEIIKKVMGSSQKIQATSKNMAEVCEQSISTVQQITASVGSVATSTDKEASGVKQVFEIVNQISEIVKLAIQTAQSNQTVASEAMLSARKGGEAIAVSLNTVDSIQRAVDEASLLLRQLAEESRKITEFVDVIQDVANDTRLFALNTRVQAAQLRKEENTKPFVVLAREIRKLSVNAKENAAQINGLTVHVMEVTRRCVAAMKTAASETASGAAMGAQAKVALEGIRASVERSSKEIALIGTVTGELEKGNQMIVNRVDEILKLSTQNAASAEQVSASAEEQSASIEELASISRELLEYGNELARAVGIFKV